MRGNRSKRKDRWTSPTSEISGEAFNRELEKWVRDQIYNASKKRLVTPVFWFELSIPTLTSEEEWRVIASKVQAIIRESEKMTIDQKPISPAFVLVTNHTFLANEDVAGEPSFALLQALHTPDCPTGRTMEIEDALAGYDKHRDIFWMIRAWRLARTIPITFDGTPPELFLPEGRPQKTFQIGDSMLVPDEDGNEVVVRIEEVASMGDKAGTRCAPRCDQ